MQVDLKKHYNTALEHFAFARFVHGQLLVSRRGHWPYSKDDVPHYEKMLAGHKAKASHARWRYRLGSSASLGFSFLFLPCEFKLFPSENERRQRRLWIEASFEADVVAAYDPCGVRILKCRIPGVRRELFSSLDELLRTVKYGEAASWSPRRGVVALCVAVGCHAFAWYTVYNLHVLRLVAAGWSDGDAASAFSSLVGAAYLATAVSGVVSSGLGRFRGLGLRTTSLLGAALACLGYGLVAASAPGSWAALLPLVVGVGLLKPCMSAMVGQLFPSGSPEVRPAYGRYYAALNVGASLSPAVAGVVLARWSGRYDVATWAAAAGDLGVVLTLALSWRSLEAADARSSMAAALRVRGDDGKLADPFDEDAGLDEAARTQRRRRLRVLWLVLVLAAVGFWPAYLQNGSGQVLWARDHVDRVVTSPWLRSLVGDEVPVPWFSLLNTVLCVVGAPLLGALAARGWRGRGASLSAVLGLGYAASAASCLLLAAAPQAGLSSASWLLGSIALGTLAEVAISALGLAQVAALSPRKHAATYTSLWYVTVAVGSRVAGSLAQHRGQGRGCFAALATLSGAALIAVAVTSRWIDAAAPGSVQDAREAPAAAAVRTKVADAPGAQPGAVAAASC